MKRLSPSRLVQIAAAAAIATMLVAPLLGGCAQSRLRIQVDVFSEDPTIAVKTSSQRLSALLSRIAGLEQDAERRIRERSRAELDKQRLVDASQRVAELLRAEPDPNGRSASLAQRPRSEISEGVYAELEDYRTLVQSRSEDARDAIDRVQGSRVGWAQTRASARDDAEVVAASSELAATYVEAQYRVAGLEAAVLSLSTEVDLEGYDDPTALRQQLVDRFGDSAGTADEVEQRIRVNVIPGLRQELEQAGRYGNRRIESVLSSEISYFRQLLSALESLDAGASAADAATAARAVPTPAAQSESVPATPDTALIAGVGGVGVANDLYSSQIDRLQDSADPVWRILADPENEEKWSQQLVDTRFHAEGNSQVIVVQDRVGHFRVVNAKNDPTALIESQARITRSIAAGALDILGAVGGVPIVSSLSDNLRERIATDVDPELEDSPGSTERTATSTNDALLAAELEAEAISFERRRRTLLAEMHRIRADISSAPDGTLDPVLYNRLSALVETYAALLEPNGG
ncbi:MAG: hypothetical protein AAFR38_01175 [Planctomycetota bacterium]